MTSVVDADAGSVVGSKLGRGSRGAAQAELALFERWQQEGDRRAREALVRRYLPLARKLALRYLGANEPVDDLVQVASLGLVKAVDRFDISHGAAFTSFAVPTILGELRRYFRDAGWAVHVPRGAQERSIKVEHAVRELTGGSACTPSVRELAQFLEWEVAEVLDALEAGAAHHAASLDASTRGEDAETHPLIDTLGAEDPRFDYTDARLSVKLAIGSLPLCEREVIRLRFIDDLTQREIGSRIGVSQMQVSRMLRSALARLHDLADPPV